MFLTYLILLIFIKCTVSFHKSALPTVKAQDHTKLSKLDKKTLISSPSNIINENLLQCKTDTTSGQVGISSYSQDLSSTILWVGGAVAFAGIIASTKGTDSAVEFASGYLLEQSLSLDNLFVFLVLFDYFKVKKEYQERVLKYGLWGATLLRAIFIGLGTIVLKEFHQVLLVFAVVLLFSSYKILFTNEDDDADEVSYIFAAIHHLLMIHSIYYSLGLRRECYCKIRKEIFENL